MTPNKRTVFSLFVIALLICPAVAADRKGEVPRFPIIRLRPDLVISSLRAKLIASNRIQYWWTVTNVGSAAANLSGAAVQAYLSTDTVWANAGDVPAGGNTLTGSLAPHTSSNGSFSANFPGNIAQFNYLVLKVDATNAVGESNENNNTAAVGVER